MVQTFNSIFSGKFTDAFFTLRDTEHFTFFVKVEPVVFQGNIRRDEVVAVRNISAFLHKGGKIFQLTDNCITAPGDFGFVDSAGAQNTGAQRLAVEMTIRAGAVAWDLNGRAAEGWKTFPYRKRR